MAAYNKYNGVPCTVHPMLKETTVESWKQDGIICTDGGAFKPLVSAHERGDDAEDERKRRHQNGSQAQPRRLQRSIEG
jgi:beta-glucosidase-like glycosyl hydrolase